MKFIPFAKLFSVLLTIAVLFVFSLPVNAASENTKTFAIVAKNDAVSNAVYYNDGKDANKVNPSSFQHIPGHNGGTAVLLNGTSQYFRLSQTVLPDFSAITFSSWIYWQGNEKNPEQKLLTLYRNQDYYLTVYMHQEDASRNINGMYMVWVTPDTDPVEVFVPTDENSSFAFPQQEWHHIAVIASDSVLSLYVDGVRHLHTTVDFDFQELGFNKLRIGTGFATQKETYLNAAFQDTFIYDTAFNDNDIALLAQSRDPLSGETAATTTGSLATRPSVSTSFQQHTANNNTLTSVLGLPPTLFYILGGIVTAIVILSCLFSIFSDKKTLSKEEPQ